MNTSFQISFMGETLLIGPFVTIKVQQIGHSFTLPCIITQQLTVCSQIKPTDQINHVFKNLGSEDRHMHVK